MNSCSMSRNRPGSREIACYLEFEWLNCVAVSKITYYKSKILLITIQRRVSLDTMILVTIITWHDFDYDYDYINLKFGVYDGKYRKKFGVQL